VISAARKVAFLVVAFRHYETHFRPCCLRCADGFSALTPLGEGFEAKFDGKFYPVVDDPGHTMVSAKRISADHVELTQQRNGKIVGISHISVAPGGRTLHIIFENKDANTEVTFDYQKQPQE
jgi:hypothetical protein